MRVPLYKSRPVEPNPADFGGLRINDFIVQSEAFSNSYLLQTSQGNIQVNAGMGIEAPVIKQNYDSFSKDAVRYLILTQGHVDHVGGVAYFREQHPGLEVIAQADNPEHQVYDARLAAFRGNRSAFAFTQKFAEAFEKYGAAGYTHYPAQDAPTPDILFEDEYRFTLGNLEVELIAVPGAETNDSLIVWLPQHRICLTGNLFGCPFGHFPNLVTIRGDRYRDALTVAAAVERVRSLGAETLLYGHHGPVAGAEVIAAELTALRGAILYVHDETVKGMNDGKDLATLMADIQLPAEFEVGQGYGKVSWSVRAIWENYAGWFKHESTTELYATPRASVNTDLVELAGGVNTLVARAQDKLAQNKPVEALHLLDILMPEYTEDAAVNAAAQAAHEALLKDSENFWLSSWLRNQIRLLQTAAA
ncbi:MAG: alkyl sulfatase BDS1-like metallo-beta-lactamase superfamily hydrolase [Bacteroidia bacterium]|jgi:alkyl sulfatase BDS1-like metallo-beta-lactamase superfamily hydrolase